MIDMVQGPLATLVQIGGPVVAILLVLSVLALAIIVLKLWQLTSLRIGSRRYAEEAMFEWFAGRRSRALEILRGSRNPVERVLASAMVGVENNPAGEVALVREEVARVAVNELENLRSYLRGLEVIGALSPLLGLLGTVLGMIEAFRQLEAAGSQVDPALLSGGIWEALLTTAVGLAVAIPAVAALNGLERVVERTSHRIEDAVTRLFTRATVDVAADPDTAADEQQPGYAA